nr:glutathione S-transferase [Dendroctonus rhizophagus]
MRRIEIEMEPPCASLTYFALPGLAEPIRWLLAYGDIKYVENPISYYIWGAYKETTPAGQLPILKINGKSLHQSMAISRYLATTLNLAGKTPLENWEIDAAVDTVTDLRLKIVAWSVEKDPATKVKLATSLQEFLPEFLRHLDDIAGKNNGHLALRKMTWADIVFAATEDFLTGVYEKGFGMKLLIGHTNLMAIVSRVRKFPTIKKWIISRPKPMYSYLD